MTAVALLLCAAALWVWPSRAAAGRLRRLTGLRGDLRPAMRRELPALAALPVIGLLTGVGPMLAAAIVAAVGVLRTRRAARRTRIDDESAALVRALGVIVAEMSVGAPMVTACRAAATEIGEVPLARELDRIAGHVELGGDLDGERSGAGSAGLRRLCDAWSTSVRHGLPMVPLVDSLRRDLVQRSEFASRTEAGMAGPRATAMVLAGLPLVGLGLGQLMGAQPIGVLLGSPLGSVLLVVGTGLGAAGLLWSDAIVARVLK